LQKAAYWSHAAAASARILVMEVSADDLVATE
jgi:hypothetical protein